MNIALWIIQILLALVFLGAGAIKSSQPLAFLEVKVGGWVHDVPLRLIRLTGVAELLGAVGLILPRAVDIAPWLTGVAAVGLAGAMVGAIVVHARRRESKEVVFNAVLFALLMVVAVVRI